MVGETLTVKQASKILQVDSNTIYRWARAGKISASKIGKEWRILKSDLSNFFEESKKTNKPSIQFLDGKNGLIQAYEKSLNSSEEILAYSSSRDMFETLPDYIQDYINRRVEKGIPMRSIIPHTLEGRRHRELALKELRATILLQLKFDFTPEIYVYEDNVIVMSLKKGEESAIIIRGKEIADAMKKIFELAWETAAKYDRWEILREGLITVPLTGKMLLENINCKKIIIEKEITDNKLDDLLQEGKIKKQIGSEQWFRNFDNWYSTTAYANPYQTVYTELKILNQNEKELARIVSNAALVFYGIGTGDTEMIFVKNSLKLNKIVEVFAIDVIDVFIHGFIQSLKNINLDYPKSEIMFKGYNTLFENTDKKMFDLRNLKAERKAHICVGNTVGNFESDKIFSIFKNNSYTGDLLVLGLQLNEKPERILAKYSQNLRFKRIVIDAVARSFGRIIDETELNWKFNEKEFQIEVWLEDVLVFRSKKFELKTLDEIAEKHSFTRIKVFSDNGFAVVLYQKQ
ncbi:MAG: L-histidine N(alpha)-methyltransferase [Candidatus Diapherotrites archaeon]